MHGLVVAHRSGLEARAARRGSDLLAGGRSTGEGRQALLVVLVGLVGETADEGEAADLDGAAGQGAAGLRAEDERAKAAERRGGAALVVGDEFAELSHQLLRCLAGRLLDGLAGLL
jgi:hypothetical protein